MNPMCLIRFISVTFNDLLLGRNGSNDYTTIMTKNDQIKSDDTTDQVTTHKTTFVVDTSGSMYRDSRMIKSKEVIINIARELITIAKQEQYDWELEFVVFNHDIRKKSFSYQSDNINSVIQFINGLYPDGSTNLYGAVYEAIEDSNIKDDSSSNLFLIFSDGDDTENTRDIQSVKEIAENSNSPIFGVAIGSDLPALQHITQAAGGTYIDTKESFNQILQYIQNSHSKHNIVKYIDTNNPDITGLKECSNSATEQQGFLDWCFDKCLAFAIDYAKTVVNECPSYFTSSTSLNPDYSAEQNYEMLCHDQCQTIVGSNTMCIDNN